MASIPVQIVLTLILLCALPPAVCAAPDSTGQRVAGTDKSATLFGPIAAYVAARQAEFDKIEPERRAKLEQISAFIREQQQSGNPARLLFVCTHNSRRSHMAQLWAAVAAEAYRVDVATYSGGTESTAFNPRAVAAMERAGFRIAKTTDDSNPIYHVRFADDHPAMTCFSKRYGGAPNPKTDFAAVMVCSDADRACPAVPGAAKRFAIPFVDPKAADNSPREEAVYDERCAQIAREMLYVMSHVTD